MSKNVKEYNHDVATGQIEVRELTDEEQAIYEATVAEKIEAKESKLAAKAAAQAKLAALGLTVEDLQALGL